MIGLSSWALLCIMAIVIAALIGIALILFRPARDRSKEAPGTSSAGTAARSTRREWISWLPYVGVALLLAIWTIWAALFFLVVVWLMRQNPAAGTDFRVSENEKRTARRAYIWLFLSPLLT